MPGKGIEAQRNELVLVELKHLSQSLDELKANVAEIASDLGTVRLAEIVAIRDRIASVEVTMRDRIAAIEGDMKVQKDQARRSGMVSGAITSTVITLIMGALFALMMRG